MLVLCPSSPLPQCQANEWTLCARVPGRADQAWGCSLDGGVDPDEDQAPGTGVLHHHISHRRPPRAAGPEATRRGLQRDTEVAHSVGKGGGLAQSLGFRLCAFGGAHWPLATAHSDPLWARTCFGRVLVRALG